MSYDILVFDLQEVPRSNKEFMNYYETLLEREVPENYDFNNPENASPALQRWFMDVKETFPQMNGPHALTEPEWADLSDESYISDYAFYENAVYIAFAWSLADEAYDTVRVSAVKHGLGFFDISGEGSIFLPDGSKLS